MVFYRTLMKDLYYKRSRMMNGFNKKVNLYLCLLAFFFIKLWNTLLWFILHKKAIVLNVFMVQEGLSIRHKNFGDDLNYYLVKALTGKYIFNYNSFFHPSINNYVCIGSIVEDMTNEKSIIWGGGVMNNEYNRFIKPLNVTAVRGPLTKAYLGKQGVQSPNVFGDPALLVSSIYKPKVSKNYSIGIIPHVSELNNPLIIDFINKTPGAVLIDLMHYKKWTEILDLIYQCKMIASSSLHGLILSDAYNIPNVWICLDKKTGGGEFKFMDYFGGVNRECIQYRVNDCLDYNVIQDYCLKYKGITFKSKELMDACPFL